MNRLLREGDIFELKKGHNVYFSIPDHFVFSNRVGCFKTKTTTDVVVGSKHPFDLSFLEGRYIAVRTELSGGGTGHGPHDVYPDGHKVTAKKVRAENEEDEIVVSFYQSGAFTAMIYPKDVEVVGTAKQKWVL